jgi:hypothetical protein
LVLAGLLSLTGCIIPPEMDLVEGARVAPSELAPGTYWVEHADGTLFLFAMPRFANDAGTAHDYAMAAPPAWYVEPALYVLDDAGNWTQDSFGADQTLDEWIQLWDAAPRP